MKKNIVISAINLDSGGPLSILKDCLEYLACNLTNKYNIIALVHDKSLIDIDGVHYYEFPLAKKKWAIRLYYEYIYFKKLSVQIKPYLWLSLHDITPNVEAKVKAVYCHNSSPFYKLTVKDSWFEPKFAIFNKFYLYLYKLNIRSNNFVIVQQKWLREMFKSFFPLDKIIVAHPSINYTNKSLEAMEKGLQPQKTFFFPAFPRVFKNFEVICEAAKILEDNGVKNFKILLTIDGTENRYSRYIIKKYSNIESLKFIGLQTREMIYNLYTQTDCLIFPSRLETWGLPITEFQKFKKPILVSNSQYSLETLNGYSMARLFDPNNSSNLSYLMKEAIDGKIEPQKISKIEVEPPFAQDWRGLFRILLKHDIDTL